MAPQALLRLDPMARNSVSLVLPTTWAMQGLLNTVLRGQGMIGVLAPPVVLQGMVLKTRRTGASFAPCHDLRMISFS